MSDAPAGTVALWPPKGAQNPTYFPKTAVANQLAKGWKEKPGRKAKSDKPKPEAQGTEEEK
ncbi:MAG: hypothetical protein AAGE01_10335 [Pseudomonadota bacterium]